MRRAALVLLLALSWLPAPVRSAGTAPLEFRVEAPASLEPAAARVRGIDRASLETSLERAGLPVPEAIQIHLIPETDARAQHTASWVVGRAFGNGVVWIFPQRVTSYPYDSTESVVRHEIVHLALSTQAGEGHLPRWFHEGVAVSVDAGWGIGASVRLLLTAAERSGVADLERLFLSERQADTTEAYLLSAALVDDLRSRYGTSVPGAIARRVGAGASFDRAFMAETGESPEMSAARALQGYRRWSRWMPAVTDGSAVWTVILLLAFVAFFARIMQRVRQRRAWDDEEARRADEAQENPGEDDEGFGDRER